MGIATGGCGMETLADYLKEHAPTKAQLEYIRSIEFSSEHRFTGKTKKEAQEFISNYAYCCMHYSQRQNHTSSEILEECEKKQRKAIIVDNDVGPYGEQTIYRQVHGPYGSYEWVSDDEGDGDAYGW